VASILYQSASTSDGRDAARQRLIRSLARRSEAGRLLTRDAERVARACHAMAERFHRGGKLIVFGAGSSSADAQHIAVEFLHPVIVGKRTLPAIALTNDVATITGVASTRGFDDAFVHQIHVACYGRGYRPRHRFGRTFGKRAARSAGGARAEPFDDRDDRQRASGRRASDRF